MAIISLNQDVCLLCGNLLMENQSIFAFPPFVSNTKDPLYKFNDSAFHVECLNKDLLGKKAIHLAEQFLIKTRPINRLCSIGGNLIKNFDDYIFIDLLTSYETEPLYKFNFITLDKNNLKRWKDKEEFIIAAKKFKNEGKWEELNSYKYLDNLIEKIQE